MDGIIDKLNHKLYMKIIVGVIVGIGVCMFIVLMNYTSTTPQKVIQTTVSQTASQAMAYVDVKGEVEKPGVYNVPSGSRLKDVIELAGGLKDSADKSRLNLAQVVSDEMVIVVYAIGQPYVENFTETGKINLNTATKEQLMTLKGIGESKATAIMNYRQTKGLFKKIEDLKQIKGFSDKLIDALKADVIVP